MLVIQIQDPGPGRHRPHQVPSLLLSSRAFCWMEMLSFGRDVGTLVEGAGVMEGPNDMFCFVVMDGHMWLPCWTAQLYTHRQGQGW